MKKFDYNVNPLVDISSKSKDKILEILKKEINFPELNFIEKILFSNKYKIIMIILFIGPGILMFLLRTFCWSYRLKKSLKGFMPYKIYKEVFEKSFNNIMVSKGIEIDDVIIKKYCGPGIPFDAKMICKNVAPTFNLGLITLQSSYVTWEWTNGDSTIRRNMIYLYSNKIDKQFNGLKLIFKKSHLFSKKGYDLENDTFNKKFYYDYNNGIKARMFFTPLIQETWVNINKNKEGHNFNKLQGFQIDVDKNFFFMARKTIFKSEYGALKASPSNNKNTFVLSLYKNFKGDVKEILSMLRLVAINKYFIK